jgi:hypothetical protein
MSPLPYIFLPTAHPTGYPRPQFPAPSSLAPDKVHMGLVVGAARGTWGSPAAPGGAPPPPPLATGALGRKRSGAHTGLKITYTGICHPVEFEQPPLVCGAAASPGPGSSVRAWSSAEYMPFSFLFSGGLVVEEGLVCVISSPVVQCALLVELQRTNVNLERCARRVLF